MLTGAQVPNASWYAIRVASHFERSVSNTLRGKEIEEFLPTYTHRAMVKGRLRDVERVLFAGYLFARFKIDNRLPILTIPGVVHIVGAGRTPLAVDERELATIRTLIEQRLFIEPWPHIRTGDRVYIERGPLRGIEGIIVQIKGTYRLVASVTLLQRSVAVGIDRSDVRPIPAKIPPDLARTPGNAAATERRISGGHRGNDSQTAA